VRRFGVALSVLTVVVVGVLLRGQPATLAQDATPVVSPVVLPALLQQWVDGINDEDGTVIGALYAPDGIHEDIPGGGIRSMGPNGIAAFFESVFVDFEDIRFEAVAARQAEDSAVLEYRFSATDVQSGKPFSFPGVVIFELEGDEIRRSADYYDVATILEELGLLDLS
jgi:ketosteroid isomerase-like protein